MQLSFKRGRKTTFFSNALLHARFEYLNYHEMCRNKNFVYKEFKEYRDSGKVASSSW